MARSCTVMSRHKRTAVQVRSKILLELPQTEIDRLTELGFLQPIDDQPAKGLKVKPVRPETGVKDDVRLRGVNSLTTAK